MGSVDVSSVGTARLVSGSRVVCERESCDEEFLVGRTRPMGERKKSKDHVFDIVPNGFLDPFWRRSGIFNFRRIEVCCGDVRREGSKGSKEASGRFIISRNSFMPKAASSTPLRPMIETCFTVER